VAGLLRAGHTDYVINDAALEYMREHAPRPRPSPGQAFAGAGLAGTLVQRLATHKRRQFADEKAWTRHLKRLGIADLAVTPDPVRVATEGALWGAVNAHGFLCEAVVVSDDAGQFNVGQHALCWVHAERLGRVEDGRGSKAPSPIPAHQTGRADFPHPAFRLVSL
jgi:hypothetical protein